MKHMTTSFRRLYIGMLVFLVLFLAAIAYAAFSTENYFMLAMGGSFVAITASLMTILGANHTKKQKALDAETEGETHAAG